MIYRELAYDLAPRPPPFPSPVSMLDQLHTGRPRKERQLANGRGGKGVGEEPRKPGRVQIIQYSLHRIIKDRTQNKYLLLHLCLAGIRCLILADNHNPSQQLLTADHQKATIEFEASKSGNLNIQIYISSPIQARQCFISEIILHITPSSESSVWLF
jgi:hypothetical protein